MSLALDAIARGNARVSTGRSLAKIRLGAALLGLAVAIPVFILCFLSARYLHRHNAFNQEDVVFAADPYYRSYAFAQGYGERSLVHPNLSNFINPWVRLAAWPLSRVFPETSAADLRMQVALAVSPLFAALTSYVIFLSALAAGVVLLKAVSLSALFGFSISTLIYGSVPDHFLISALVLSLAVLLLELDGGLGDRFRRAAWLTLVTLAGSITITNMFPLSLLFFLAQMVSGTSLCVSARRAASLFGRAALLILLSWLALNWVYGDFSALKAGHAYNKNLGRIGAHLTDNPARDFLSFPFTFGQAFWGGTPDVEKIPQYPRPEIASYDVSILYNPPFHKSLFYGIVLLVPIFLAGLSVYWGHRLRPEDTWPFAAAAIVFCLFSWLLHTLWGGVELFLFNQHWHFASVLALTPLALVWRSRLSGAVFIGAAIALTVANLIVWRDVLVLVPRLALR